MKNKNIKRWRPKKWRCQPLIGRMCTDYKCEVILLGGQSARTVVSSAGGARSIPDGGTYFHLYDV